MLRADVADTCLIKPRASLSQELQVFGESAGLPIDARPGEDRGKVPA
jgi:hypothetical protein